MAPSRKNKRTASNAEGLALEDAIGNMSALLREKQDELEERAETLKSEQAAFDREREKVYGKTLPSDVVELNVGGTPCTVLRRTLCQVEDSMLASRFSGRWDDSLEKDGEGRFIIDQKAGLFDELLTFLRSMANESAAAPLLRAPTFHSETYSHRGDAIHFMRMVEYYGCTEAIYRINVSLVRGKPDDVAIVQFPEYSIDTRELSTFTIITEYAAHREIEAFEVELGEVEQVMIGWVSDQFATTETINLNFSSKPEIWTSAAHDKMNMVLDCGRKAMFGQSKTYSDLQGQISLAQGTVIRCERTGCKWFADGVFLGSGNSLLDQYGPGHQILRNQGVPAFACKGSVRIKSVEFSL
jgi:hypothetical protein